MPALIVDFDVYCAECGAGLCNKTDVEECYGNKNVKVGPCTDCLEAAGEAGYSKGYEQAKEDYGE